MALSKAAAAESQATTPTAAVAAFVAGFDYSQISDLEREAVGRQTMDTLGVAIAGSQSAVVQKLVAALEPATGPVLIPGLARSFDRVTAAYLFGVAAHSIEFDDGHRGGSVHPGAVIVPAVLAYAAGRQVSGKDLLRAIAIGYQVTVSLAEDLNPRARGRGFHNTPIAGVFGATAAVAALMRLNPAQVEDALGLVGSSAAGLFAFLLGGGDVKPLHAGFAAREGLLAATYAQAGLTGPKGIFECQDGFFQAFSGAAPSAAFLEAFSLPRPQASLKIVDSYIKPYSCCAHIHPAIDGVLDLMAEAHVGPADIEQIESGTYVIAAEHRHVGWKTLSEAQLSYPYCVATAALSGFVGPSLFSDQARSSAAIADFAKRITVDVDPEAQAVYPKARSAAVTLTLKDGRKLARRVVEPRGSPSKPVENAALSTKFHSLTDPVLGRDAADRLEAFARDLASVNDANSWNAQA